MGIIKGAKNRLMAQKFIDFMLTEDFQKEIPLTNWMYPVNPKVSLPDSFRYAPRPGSQENHFLLAHTQYRKTRSDGLMAGLRWLQDKLIFPE